MGDSTRIHNPHLAAQHAFPHVNGSYSSSQRPRTTPGPPQRNPGYQWFDLNKPLRQAFPPPPSVEDEAVSLAREYGSSSLGGASDEETPSRGDIEQQPLIMEVHEFNPERRFVILNESAKPVAEESEALPNFNSPRDMADGPRNKRSDNESTKDNDAGRMAEKSRDSSARPRVDSRTSKQDLPRLETEAPSDRPPERPRSRSSAAADAPRPDYFFPRQSRMFEDQLLSPDVLQSGFGRRENSNEGCDDASAAHNRLPNRSAKLETAEKSGGSLHHRRTRTASSSRRFDECQGSIQSANRLSGELAGARIQKENSPTTRSITRDSSRLHGRREGEEGRATPPRSPREPSYSSSGLPFDKHGRSYSYKTPTVIHGDSDWSDNSQRAGDAAGMPSSRWRMRTTPIPDSAGGLAAATAALLPRSSATFPVTSESGRPHREDQVCPPYPDDDDPLQIRPDYQEGLSRYSRTTTRGPPPITMPEPTRNTATAIDRTGETKKPTTPLATPRAIPETWQVPSFDPEKSRKTTDRAPGSYRRYSETKDQNGSVSLPECPRTDPSMGKMDWLTLPRTNFNICPTCYEAVFAKSEFRTHFQPMLRPTGEPIACDFGSSPWYRIAWLLTLKHGRSDLRLFYQVVNVTASSRGTGCPGNRKATRNWLTVVNPDTRRSVSEFAVCYECAMTIEALLPNLSGLFVPLGSRSQPMRHICALHFAPKRKHFVHIFDALETTSDRAYLANQPPDIADLADELQQLSVGQECREDSPVRDGNWHVMQSLPEFTVCSTCFGEVIQPRLKDGDEIAQSFSAKPQRLAIATCQLYSPRMREIFQKACRRRDHDYLETKVLERREIEANIFDKLLKLDREKRNDEWTEKQVERLVDEWRRWE
ncbi:hypothetical protein HIM_06466 [Hirsutella minnesotensis 3608]|uniref:Uncharacterized protein n=1 Tax=Hirsutella minnesotensis 3608 TaxID=1043627 RepID=A0A0F7ZNS0_9HYPO|nr:hypothetical protein HIM_06466 [Hirsutella minnesotensis 3608]